MLVLSRCPDDGSMHRAGAPLRHSQRPPPHLDRAALGRVRLFGHAGNATRPMSDGQRPECPVGSVLDPDGDRAESPIARIEGGATMTPWRGRIPLLSIRTASSSA